MTLEFSLKRGVYLRGKTAWKGKEGKERRGREGEEGKERKIKEWRAVMRVSKRIEGEGRGREGKRGEERGREGKRGETCVCACSLSLRRTRAVLVHQSELVANVSDLRIGVGHRDVPQRQLLELGVARKLLERIDDVDVERDVRGDTVLAHPLVRERLRRSNPSLYIHWNK